MSYTSACRASGAYLLLIWALALLAGCSAAPGAEPTLQPALMPSAPTAALPTGGPAPAPTAAAPGAALPGRLLFVQSGNLWLWHGDSGRQLTSTGDAIQPAWSPDGTRIAYVRRVNSASDLLLLPAEGTGAPTQLTDNSPDPALYSYDRIYNSVWAFYPAWSPDGVTLAYASQFGPPGGAPVAEYRMALFVIAAAGGPPSQIYSAANGQVGRPVYAPDGSTIVFAFDPTGDDPPALYRYTTATEVAEPLLGAPQQSYDPTFSADGRWLAFAARTGTTTDIFALPPGGGTPTRLTTSGTARAPAFAPDGSALAFLAVAPGGSSFDLWVADLRRDAAGTLQAGEPRQITHDMHLDADSGIAWAR